MTIRDLLLGAPEHVDAVLDQGVQVGRQDFVFSAAGQPQQLPGELGGAADMLLDAFEMLVIRLADLAFHEQQRSPALNAHQQVVEIMGDAGRQGADGLHFLGLLQQFLLVPQGLLGDLALVDVGQDAVEAMKFAFPENGPAGRRYPAAFAVLVDEAVFAGLKDILGHQLELFHEQFPVLGINEIQKLRPQSSLGLVADEVLDARADEAHDAVLIDLENRLADVVRTDCGTFPRVRPAALPGPCGARRHGSPPRLRRAGLPRRGWPGR